GWGDAYVTGFTSDAQKSNYDAYVAKVSADGSKLLDVTTVGGSGGDYGYALALDIAGNVYVTGETRSADFPVTSGAFQTKYGGAPSDAFIARFRAAPNTDNQPSDATIFFQNSQTGQLVYWLMNGPNLRQIGLVDPSIPGPSEWKLVGMGDFNQDG